METSNIYENKTKEEIVNMTKNYLVNLCNNAKAMNQFYDEHEKTLENLDESAIGFLGENKRSLYNLVNLLNTYAPNRSTNEKNTIEYKNVIENIHGILNGFGSSTDKICEMIETTSRINPDIVVEQYSKLVGLNFIPKNELLNTIETLKNNNQYEELAELYLEEGERTKFGLLIETKEEFIDKMQGMHR